MKSHRLLPFILLVLTVLLGCNFHEGFLSFPSRNAGREQSVIRGYAYEPGTTTLVLEPELEEDTAEVDAVDEDKSSELKEDDLADAEDANTFLHELDGTQLEAIEDKSSELKEDDLADAEDANTFLHELDGTQLEAIEAVVQGRNVLITGGAGVGKTRTATAVIQALKQKYGAGFDDKVGVVASTGSAAVLLEGCTLHHLMGFGVPKIAKDFRGLRSSFNKVIWEETLKVLVIDEASMISGEFFDLFEEQVRVLRKRPDAFGGIQIVLIADFFQLAPIQVQEKSNLNEISGVKEPVLNRGMLFQSDAWHTLNLSVVKLEHTYRQTDLEFVEMLKILRTRSLESKVSKAVDWINERCLTTKFKEDEADVVSLFAKKNAAEELNKVKLTRLPTKLKTFQAKDSIEVKTHRIFETEEEAIAWRQKAYNFLNRSSFWTEDSSNPQLVQLKVGAQVMLTANLDVRAGLSNGRMGTVIGFTLVKRRRRAVIVDFLGLGRRTILPFEFKSRTPGLGECIRIQMPLILAWGMTVHRSQGKTLEKVRVDPHSFCTGQGYVALSRVTQISGLELLAPLKTSDLRVNAASKKLEWHLSEEGVTFQGGNGQNGQWLRQNAGTWREPAVGRLQRSVAQESGPDVVFQHGKHQGRTFADVLRTDSSYFAWARRQEDVSIELKAFIDFGNSAEGQAQAPTRAMKDGERVFQFGRYSGRTFGDVLGSEPGYARWASQLPDPSYELRDFVDYASRVSGTERPNLQDPEEDGPVFTFGKYRGRSYASIARSVPDYVAWARKAVAKDGSPRLMEFLSFVDSIEVD